MIDYIIVNGNVIFRVFYTGDVNGVRVFLFKRRWNTTVGNRNCNELSSWILAWKVGIRMSLESEKISAS